MASLFNISRDVRNKKTKKKKVWPVKNLKQQEPTSMVDR